MAVEREMSGGGRVLRVEAPSKAGSAGVLEDRTAWLREQGVVTAPHPEPAGMAQKRDEAGRWM